MARVYPRKDGKIQTSLSQEPGGSWRSEKHGKYVQHKNKIISYKFGSGMAFGLRGGVRNQA